MRRGELTHEEADRHPQRSIITRALGPEDEVEVDHQSWPAQAGDVYLLCSDGLTAMVPEARVADIVRGAHVAARRRARRSSTRPTPRAARTTSPSSCSASTRSRDGAPMSPRRADRPPISATAAEAAGGRVGAAGRRRGGRAATRRRAGSPRASRARPSARKAAPAPPAAAPRSRRARDHPRHRRCRSRSARRSRCSRSTSSAPTTRAIVTVYQGVPYDLPGGAHLYTTDFVSGVNAQSLARRAGARCWTTRCAAASDALSLVRQLELGTADANERPQPRAVRADPRVAAADRGLRGDLHPAPRPAVQRVADLRR